MPTGTTSRFIPVTNPYPSRTREDHNDPVGDVPSPPLPRPDRTTPGDPAGGAYPTCCLRSPDRQSRVRTMASPARGRNSRGMPPETTFAPYKGDPAAPPGFGSRSLSPRRSRSGWHRTTSPPARSRARWLRPLCRTSPASPRKRPRPDPNTSSPPSRRAGPLPSCSSLNTPFHPGPRGTEVENGIYAMPKPTSVRDGSKERRGT